MNIATTKRDILNSFMDKEYRAAFNEENVYTTICFQLRALREQRNMSQGALGKQVRPIMAQERISILEDPNADTKPTLNTLLRLADGLDVGLEVRFVPFSKVLADAINTSMKNLEVTSFQDELPSLQGAVQGCSTNAVVNACATSGYVSNANNSPFSTCFTANWTFAVSNNALGGTVDTNALQTAGSINATVVGVTDPMQVTGGGTRPTLTGLQSGMIHGSGGTTDTVLEKFPPSSAQILDPEQGVHLA